MTLERGLIQYCRGVFCGQKKGALFTGRLFNLVVISLVHLTFQSSSLDLTQAPYEQGGRSGEDERPNYEVKV